MGLRRGLLRLFLRLAATRAGGWFFTTVTPPLDRKLLMWSTGRFSVAGAVSPTLMLITTGRRTGRQRHTPLLYLTDGDVASVAPPLYIIGSRGGRRAQAGWYYNVMSESRVEVLVAGQRRRCTARLLEGAERERVWDHFVRFNPHFNRYQARVSREIPVIALEGRPADYA